MFHSMKEKTTIMGRGNFQNDICFNFFFFNLTSCIFPMRHPTQVFPLKNRQVQPLLIHIRWYGLGLYVISCFIFYFLFSFPCLFTLPVLFVTLHLIACTWFLKTCISGSDQCLSSLQCFVLTLPDFFFSLCPVVCLSRGLILVLTLICLYLPLISYYIFAVQELQNYRLHN